MSSDTRADGMTPVNVAADGSVARGAAGGPLGHIPLFCKLDETESRALSASLERREVAPGDAVCWFGESGGSMFVIDAGRVDVSVPNERGEHVLLNHLGPGGFFGEISLLDGGARTATVRAAEATTLLVLSREAFRRFVHDHPDAALDILTVMGARQRAANEAIRGLANPNSAFERTRTTVWQRASDMIATVAASQWFTVFHLSWFGAWIGLNTLGSVLYGPFGEANPQPRWVFDPFPFGLLTMVVSLEAIFLSIFVMVSQNRQSEKDRLRIDLDYQVNVKAQTEIMAISRRLERIEASLAGTDARGGG
ncbi:MAG: DUF1003 domain-containing protein [Phycisphaerae bacterium]|nr:DUF1003 domain-containing protein [Phycisphaerae bacterium]